MILNLFSVRVIPGSERESGYHEIAHGTPFAIQLHNYREVRCDARVEVNGKDQGTFRLGPRQSINLERGANDVGRFTAYVSGTAEASTADIAPGSRDNGLIRVTFTPERVPVYSSAPVSEAPHLYSTPGASQSYSTKGGILRSRGMGGQSVNSGGYAEVGVGLSGESAQRFYSVEPLDLDYAQQTTISLRLVSPNPEASYPTLMQSNPVPPPVPPALSGGPRPLR